jgi:hypothetical protein
MTLKWIFTYIYPPFLMFKEVFWEDLPLQCFCIEFISSLVWHGVLNIPPQKGSKTGFWLVLGRYIPVLANYWVLTRLSGQVQASNNLPVDSGYGKYPRQNLPSLVLGFMILRNTMVVGYHFNKRQYLPRFIWGTTKFHPSQISSICYSHPFRHPNAFIHLGS